MKPYAGKEIGPGDNANSDEEIEEYIRSKAETAYHPSCTLKMGIDDMAVVVEVFSQCPDLITFFENPFYEDYIKVGVIMSLFINEDSLSDKNSSQHHIKELNKCVDIIPFLQILMYRRRMSLILPIATRFKELCDELVGIKDAFCFSANALTSSQEKELVDKIQQNKEEIENYKLQADKAEREGDYAFVAELRYGKIKIAQETTRRMVHGEIKLKT